MPTMQEIVSDPNFLGLPVNERIKALKMIDPNFAGLPEQEQFKAVMMLREPEKVFSNLKPGEFVDPQTGQIKSIVAQSGDPTVQVLNKLNEPFEAAGTAAGQFVQRKVEPLIGGTGSDIAGALTSGTVQTIGPSLILRGVLSGGKALTQAAGKFINPGATRTAGVEAAVEKLGAEPNTVTRAYAPKPSKGLFEQVSRQEPVPTDSINNAILSAIDKVRSKANPPKAAVTHLENLFDKYSRSPTAKYDDVVAEMQDLRIKADSAFRTGDNLTGVRLNEARAQILDELDNISPIIKQANAQYRREQSIEKIAKVLSSPRPDVRLGELFVNDPLVKGIIPQSEAKFLEKIAAEIGTMGTQASPYSGVGARALNFLSTPVAKLMATPAGRYLLRQTFKEGKVSREGLIALMQMIRTSETPGANVQQ